MPPIQLENELSATNKPQAHVSHQHVSKKTTTICLDHMGRCLRLSTDASRHAPGWSGAPVILAKRGDAPSVLEEWRVGEHSIEYSGADGYSPMHPSVCIAGINVTR